MPVSLKAITLSNPNPSSVSSLLSAKNKAVLMAVSLSSPSSLRFDPLLRPRCCRITSSPARGLAFRRPTSGFRPVVVAFAASHEESKHSEIEVEKEKDNLKSEAEDSQEAWREALESFKEQAIKIQGVSQEAYEIYSKKALIILKETSEQLKIQADKAQHDLSEIVKEISEEGKEYISTAAEKSPEVKEIVETLTAPTDDLTDISSIHDFRVGIPYGLLLSVGGFLSFMVTGNTASIRFGVILGGALLAMSISSLRLHKQGEQSPLAVKGQAVIAGILFLREVRLLAQRSSFISLITTVISGAVAAFYIYKITLDGKHEDGSHLGKKAES